MNRLRAPTPQAPRGPWLGHSQAQASGWLTPQDPQGGSWGAGTAGVHPQELPLRGSPEIPTQTPDTLGPCLRQSRWCQGWVVGSNQAGMCTETPGHQETTSQEGCPHPGHRSRCPTGWGC